MRKLMILVALMTLAASATVKAQIQTDPEKRAAEIQQQRDRATKWVDKLELNDPDKESRVIEVITTYLMAVRDWHNTHPFTDVPKGINPRTGGKLNKLDRQMIAVSAIPSSVHTAVMEGLRADLTEEQVEQILDEYTIGKVAFTMQGYREYILDMTPEEEAYILEMLKKAREEAIDYKNNDQISAIFKIYKTQIELWLYQNDRNWRKIYKDWVDRINAAKQE
ncbi:MAG: DUF3826 domain-containing protein [Rikenellaceae bacterium]|nr:DUF3826 domain-containing protein [Rikenellaceae bacterium]